MNDLVKTGEYTEVNKNFMAPLNPRVAAINAQVAASPLAAQGISQAPSAITSSSLQSVTPMKLSQPGPLTEADGLLGAIETGATSFQTDLQSKTQQNNELAQQKAKMDSSKQSIWQKMGISKGEAELTDQEYSQTVDPVEAELTNINKEIFEAQNGFRKQIENVQKIGTLTDVQKQNRIDQMKREEASYEADLYIKQMGIQGRYDSAKRIADRKIAVALEKDKRDLELLRFDYEENKEQFNKQEQRQFETAQRDRERALDAKERTMKTYEDTKLALLKSANEQNAPIGVKTAIANARTVEEAIQAAGVYSGDILERQLKLKQLENIQSQIDERNLTGNGADPYSILAYAQQYASNGNIPTGIPKGSFGLISQAAKELPKPAGTIVDVNTGIKSSGLSDKQSDGINALYDITQKVAQLKQLEAEIVPGFVGGVTGKVFGSDDQRKYLDLRQEIVDLLARARTGAALTAQEEKFYTDQLPGRFSNSFFLGTEGSSRIDNFDSKIQGTLQSKLSNFGASIYGYSKVKTPVGEFTVGDVITQNGVTGRVNPDGTITLLTQ